MTGVPLTEKESKALLQLSQYLARPEDIGLTDDELDTLETKLHAGPTNEFETRLTEAVAACSGMKRGYSAKLGIVELGVRVTVMGPNLVHIVVICPWIDVAMCCINPLLSAIDRAVKKLESAS